MNKFCLYLFEKKNTKNQCKNPLIHLQKLGGILIVLLSAFSVYSGSVPQFKVKDTLNFAPNYQVNPGQLSKDGLEYYMSLKDAAGEYLYVMKREVITDTFQTPQLMNEFINITDYLRSPSITEDKKTLVFSGRRSDWPSYDLYIATRSDITKGSLKNNFSFEAINNSSILERLYHV